MHAKIRGGSALALTLAAALSAGCVKNRAVVRVNPDGSGELRLESLINPALLAQLDREMERQRARASERGVEAPPAKSLREALFGERTLRYLAPLYGEVEFVESRTLDRDGLAGVEAVYRFSDIGKVWLPIDFESRDRALTRMLRGVEGEEPPPLQSRKSDACIEFEWTPAARGGRLAVRMPELRLIELEDDPNWTPPEQSNMTRTMARDPDTAAMFGVTPEMNHVQMLKKVFGPMEMRIELQIAGAVRSTTAKHPVPARPRAYTLFKMDLASVLESERGIRLYSDERNLSGSMPPLAKDVPGIEFETGEVTFEIAP